MKRPWYVLILVFLVAGMLVPAAAAQGPVPSEEVVPASTPQAGIDNVSWRYEFASSVGTYTEIVTGTVHGTPSNDDQSFPGIDLGFTFTYDGVDYTQISIQSNGWIAMGSSIASSYYPLSTGTTNNVIAALGRDIEGNDTTSELRSLTEGTAPNRVFTVQWKDYKRYGSTYVGDAFDFQIKLYETSNVIEIVYGDFTVLYVASPPYFPQVGLRGDSNADFNNRKTDATHFWADSLRGTANTDVMALTDVIYPPTGLTYDWGLFTGVYLDPPAQSGSVCKGGDVVYDLDLVNLTAMTTSFSLVYTSTWTATGPSVSPVLAPGEVWPFQVSVHIPWSANVGDQDTLTIGAYGAGESAQATATTTAAMVAGYTDYANAPRPVRDHGVVYWDGKIYKVGGYDGGYRDYLDIYDIASDTWYTGTNIPAGRDYWDCVAIDAKIYCASGYNAGGQTDLYIYDIGTNAWSTGAPLPEYRYTYAGVALGGKYYVIGGYGPAPSPYYKDTIWAYDPGTDTWDTSLTPMSTGRRYHSAEAIGGKIYVAGGYVSPGGYLDSAEVYDPVTDTWTPIASMPSTWCRAGDAVKHDRYLLMFGGDDNSSAVSSEYGLIYDTVLDQWDWLPVMDHLLYATEADGDGNDVWISSGRLYEGGYRYSEYHFKMVQCPESCDPVTSADFSWDPPVPLVGYEVVFTGVATGTPAIQYEWSFDDGMTGTGQIVPHTYAAPGIYTVVMTATNCDGAGQAVASHDVQVILPPTIEVTPDSLWAVQCPDEITTQDLVICNLGDLPLEWEIHEMSPTVPLATIPAPAAAPKQRPVITSPEQCAAYENYTGAEPIGAAEFCHPDIVPAPAAVAPMAPTDIGYAQDIGYISDNFVTFVLNDFPGQTVLGTTTNVYYGMDFDPAAEVLYALNDTTGQLGTISLVDGSFTGLVACPPPVDIWTGLTIDPVNGIFYASDATDLYIVDPATGNYTLVGSFNTGGAMIDIAMNMDGEMYGHDIGTDSIYSIDPATGQATLIGPTTYAANYAQGMDFDNDDGTLYIFLYIGSGANVYGTVNLATGQVTPLAVDNPLGEFEGATQTGEAYVDIPWLAEDPITGTVPAQGCTTVTVSFDSTGLVPNDYFANLLIESNDPANPEVTVPVTLTVNPPADLELTAPPLDVEVCADAMMTLTMDLCNVGGCPLDWIITDTADWLSEDPTSGSLGADECITVSVVFDATGMGTGVYTASLVLESNDPETPTIVLPVTMTVNPVPEASFDYDPISGTAPLTVYFTNTSLYAISPTWDFGDGSPAEMGDFVTHTYAVAGDYTATLTVESMYGCGSDTASAMVQVASACVEPAGVDFTWMPITPTAGTTVDFYGSVLTGTSPLTFTWAFGDGGQASGMDVTHVFTAAGTYVVTLTVANPCGQDSAVHSVVVQTPMYYVYLPLVFKGYTAP